MSYGTVLQTFNGRNPYIDFLQEQADGTCYATQLYLEAMAFGSLLQKASGLIDDVIYARQNDLWLLNRTLDRLVQLRGEVDACLKQSGLLDSENSRPPHST